MCQPDQIKVLRKRRRGNGIREGGERKRCIRKERAYEKVMSVNVICHLQ